MSGGILARFTIVGYLDRLLDEVFRPIPLLVYDVPVVCISHNGVGHSTRDTRVRGDLFGGLSLKLRHGGGSRWKHTPGRRCGSISGV